MSLQALAEASGVAYTHLSRIESDSTVPGAETVAKLCAALSGDLKVMLELADCLPRVILDRIQAGELNQGVALNRSFQMPDLPVGGDKDSIVEIAKYAHLDDAEVSEVMSAVKQMVMLSKGKRAAVANLIAMLYAEGDDPSS